MRKLLIVLIFGLVSVWVFSCSEGERISGNTGGDNDVEPAGDQEVVDYEGGELPTGACFSDADCAVLRQCKSNSSEVKGCVCLKGVCVPKPLKEATIWWEDSHPNEDGTGKEGDYRECDAEHCGTTSVDTSCVGAQFEEQESAPTTKVNGRIKVFGLKAPCDVLSVYVFLQYDENGNLADYTNNDDAIAVGETPSEPDPTTGECPVVINDVPTGKWLVIKSTDGDNEFKDTYQFNVFIKPEDADNSNGVPLEINAISATSYQMVPITAGLTAGIPANRGAIAGTVKDCLGNLVSLATVGVTGDTLKISYFDANVEDLLPQSGRLTTNRDATWVSLGHEEGVWEAVAAVKVNGEIVASRKIQYRIYRNSVSIVPFRFDNPMNYPITE